MAVDGRSSTGDDRTDKPDNLLQFRRSAKTEGGWAEVDEAGMEFIPSVESATRA